MRRDQPALPQDPGDPLRRRAPISAASPPWIGRRCPPPTASPPASRARTSPWLARAPESRRKPAVACASPPASARCGMAPCSCRTWPPPSARGPARVLADLAALGYDAQWAALRAGGVGTRTLVPACSSWPPARPPSGVWPLLPTPQARDHHRAQLPELRRAWGNSVVPRQAAAALRLLIQAAAVPGSRGSADLTGRHQMNVDAGGPGRKASRARTPAAPGTRGRPAPPPAARAPQRPAEGVPVAANPDSPWSRRRAA
jgi:hypothetical protein